ncbi:MAG: ParB/RepB/Spo0J family partition protein [Fulvimarina manganoxydans]|uniref:ParB/RepB/Spo0J family partition protein n=1 Tax=Fulvimarina manganoxydans TaxID=937218 RepID=UPI002354FED0|nr:ParB/RepB/Spo0J family partition protein [Fulvimarina manganoxydans]MCK5931954.1 ParB/RepB/Spo0J family partition protein [Fulvimarina manganoxydans]
MSEDRSRQRLGRGLASLIGPGNHGGFRPAAANKVPEAESAVPMQAERVVALDRVVPNPNNPRRTFSEDDLADLTASVRKHGIVQPLLVRPDPDREGGFEIVAGERRFRAAKAAELKEVPIVLRDIDDRQSIEIALIENVQRTDLNAIEEALAYERLIDEHGYTQADLAEGLGKSRSHVANTLRLLRLPESVRAMVVEGKLSAGAARTLVNAENPERVARAIVEDGLSVRQAEELARTAGNGQDDEDPAESPARERRAPTPNAHLAAIERRLAARLDLAVKVKGKPNKGSIRIEYGSAEELQRILARIGLDD